MATISPNMNLNIPTIGVDSGLTWETDVNINTNIIDGHNHSSGNGVQVTPLGLLINQDLTFGENNATSLRSVRMVPQSPLFTASLDVDCIYVSGVDLYYRDGNGNNVQITTGGGINATSTGIVNGTATAAFASYILVVTAASNTPASIKGGSLIMGQSGVSGSNYLIITPPSSLSSGNYSLVLPGVSPSGSQLLQIDTSGNITPTASVSTTIANNIGTSMGTSGANAVAATMDSTGANSIGNNMGPLGANSIGNNMGATGANAILASSNSYRVAGSGLLVGNPSVSPAHFIYGYVQSTGSILFGTGFSVNHTGTGTYTISWSSGITNPPVVIVTPAGSVNPIIAVVGGVNNTSANLTLFNVNSGPVNIDFSFLIIG